MELAGTPDVPDGNVLLWREQDGIVVIGDEQDRSRFLESLDVARTHVTTAGAAAGSVAAVAGTAGEYFRLTKTSAEKLHVLGKQHDPSGSMYGFVKSGNRFAGNLRFEEVPVAPEQVLALQSAAVSLALRSAIADVQAAVERVEDKVEDVQRHLRAQLNGDVIGTLRHLERVATATQQRGVLLEADWASVATVRVDISRNLERLRDFVARQAGEIDALARLPRREAKLDDFLEPGGGRDQLNLILVSQHSLHLWEMLRVAQVRQREPAHVESAIEDARRSLAQERRKNEELIISVSAAVDDLRQIRPLEVHRFFSAREMRQTAADIHDSLAQFAEAARLPLPEVGEIVQPTVRDARDEAQARALDAARTVRALGTAAAHTGSSVLGKSRESARRRLRRDRPDAEHGPDAPHMIERDLPPETEPAD
ncbi:hypothetical protein JK386_14790 [Nocardioides sp. zg-536]|uniref:Uncharacterized protein n=1 Tax=Nocardioides faecalis TaxID=2803858 RepID=A0A938YBX7_9ACTN|nr:hypothetical protein [Nocardioides faecalis]MBM9461166.1 hypothetical protein [Nocardioides faecalis]QVI59016.1 hypothetical protein KG111_01045 [Nocardioides faecalis]